MSLRAPDFSSPVTSHLSLLDEAHCQVLLASASALVRRKELLDDLREETKDRWLVPDVLPSEHGSSVDSFGFLSVVLPFLDMTPREHEFPARIPTDLTLGECCGRKLDDITPSERDRLLALLSSDDRAFHDEKGTATALWIRPLSLFAVDHGKKSGALPALDGRGHHAGGSDYVGLSRRRPADDPLRASGRAAARLART